VYSHIVITTKEMIFVHIIESSSVNYQYCNCWWSDRNL